MRKAKNFFEKHHLMVSVLLMLLAVMTGGGLMADAAVVEPDPANPDPVDPTVNDLQSPDGNGAGQDLTGTQGSATQMRRGDLAEDEYDPEIVKFRASKNVLLNHARTIAKQRKTKGYEVKHYRIGEEDLMLKTTAAIAAGDKVTLTSENCSGNLNLLGVSTTVTVKGVDGYVDGSTTKKDGGPLQLLVVEATEESVSLRPLNGITKVDGKTSDYLRDYTCPAIPANTELVINAIAGIESQMIVAPDNSQPRPETVFLQKQIFNILLTDHEREILKKTPWSLSEMKEQALANFSKKAEYTLWVGKQKRFLMRTKDGNEEYGYTSQGVLRQLTNTLGLEGAFQWTDIAPIGKVMFTNFAESTEAYCYCGKNKITELINMDMTKHHDAEFTHKKTDYGVIVRDLVSNFGTLHVVHAPALDDLGYSDFMVIIPTQDARYYRNIVKREATIDLKKAGNDAREASRYIYIESGALALRGYNSLLVGPSDQIASKNLSNSSNPIVVVTALPQNPSDGMIITFDTDMDFNGTTLSADKVWQWNGTEWVEYNATVG